MRFHALIVWLLWCVSGPLWAAPASFIVNFSDGPGLSRPDALSRIAQATGLTVISLRQMGQPGSFAVVLELGPSTRSAVESALRSLPQVRKVHDDFLFLPAALAPVPNDPQYVSGQSVYFDSGRYASLRMRTAWGLQRGSSSVVVAVLDSGALLNHPDLRGRWLPGYDFVSTASPPTGLQSTSVEGGSNDGDGRDPDASDPGDAAPGGACRTGQMGSSFHGTAVASVLAATTNNGIGIAGVNGAVRVLPLRISGQCGFARTSDIIDAMYWAVGDPVPDIPNNPTPVQVVNFSFAGGLGLLGCADTVFDDAIARVKARGAVFVTAAGNRGGALESPASCRGALAAGTVTADGLKASYSAYGPSGSDNVVLMTPSGLDEGFAAAGNRGLPDGRPDPDGHGTVRIAGTSFSSPTLAAVVALLAQARPDFSADRLIATLRDTSLDFPPAGSTPPCLPAALSGSSVQCACTRARCGSGIVNPSAALLQARAGQPLANPPFAVVQPQAGPVSLDASLSTAVNGGSQGLMYRWRQVAGPAFSLQGTDGPLLEARPRDGAAGTSVFELLVTDTATNRTHAAQTAVISLAGLPGSTAQPAGGSDAGPPTSPTQATPAGGSSGGGGALHHGWWLLLLGLGALRRVGKGSGV